MSVTTNLRSTVEALCAISLLGIGALAAAPSVAAAETYEYRINHPTDGEIGRDPRLVTSRRGGWR